VKGGNKWAAAVVSIGEQRILERARDRASSLLALVICAWCKDVRDNNKKCGRCRKVVYCGVECQKLHRKQHKPHCTM
jgi:hypothetical protein